MIDSTNTKQLAHEIYVAATLQLKLSNADWPRLERVIRGIIEQAAKPEPELERIRKIQSEVCRRYKVEIDVMTSARRTRDEVFPRQVAMYLCTKRTAAPLHAIARAFGKKERGTITYAIDTVVEKMKKDSETRRTVEGLMNNLLF